MRRIRLIVAVKMDQPYIVGDLNAELTVEDTVAEFAVRNKLGEYVGDPLKLGPTRAELEAEEAQIGTLKKLGENAPEIVALLEDGQPVPEVAGIPDSPDETPVARPYGNAPKSAWVRYAVAMDPELTEERAETWTKADLMSKFGARLGEED